MGFIKSNSLLFYCLFRGIHKVADLTFNWLIVFVCFKHAAINARHFNIWKCLTSIPQLVLACVTNKVNPFHFTNLYIFGKDTTFFQ